MLFETKNLDSGYGKRQVLYDVSLSVRQGEFVGIIGHNGAGKSTVLKSILGTVRPFRGHVLYMNQDVTFDPPVRKLDLGMYHIPQENFIFNNLSVEDNLELALFTARDKSRFESKYREVYEIFPILKERQNQLAGTLSGGERRILSIGMGFLRQPNFLMLDEPSGGLSPIAFKNVVKIIEEINRKIGTAILIVEQNVKVTFRICERVYVMKAGHVILEETGQKLLERNSWWELF